MIEIKKDSLLSDGEDYEEYTENIVKEQTKSGCGSGGCCKTGGGCCRSKKK